MCEGESEFHRNKRVTGILRIFDIYLAVPKALRIIHFYTTSSEDFGYVSRQSEALTNLGC